jgi:hypothetical protein
VGEIEAGKLPDVAVADNPTCGFGKKSCSINKMNRAHQRMIPKSGYRFSEKIMRQQEL